MAITEQQLSKILQDAFDFDSDKEVNPAEARKRLAEKIASGVAQFVIGRTTVVTGASATGGPVTGKGIIQNV